MHQYPLCCLLCAFKNQKQFCVEIQPPTKTIALTDTTMHDDQAHEANHSYDRIINYRNHYCTTPASKRFSRAMTTIDPNSLPIINEHNITSRMCSIANQTNETIRDTTQNLTHTTARLQVTQ